MSKSSTRRYAALLGLAVSWTLLGAPAATQTNMVRPGILALVGGTIYVDPTSETIRDGVLVIQDGKIAGVGSRRSVQIPRGARTIDCA